MDVQVDKEKDRKKGSKKNGQVSTELNLKGEGSGGKGLNNRVHGVHGESRSRESSGRGGGGDNLGGCVIKRRTMNVRISNTSYENKI